MKVFHALTIAVFMLSIFGIRAAGAQSSAGEILETMNSFSGDTDLEASYWNSLSGADQQAFLNAMANPDVSVDVTYDTGGSTLMSSNCGTATARGSYASAGILLYRFYSATYWCWDGSTVWNISSAGSWAEVDSWGWEYVIDDNYPWMTLENWGTAAYKFSQGHFRLCYGAAGCVQHTYPWIKSYGEEDGSLNWDQS